MSEERCQVCSAVGTEIRCTTCAQLKKPLGRSAPLSWYGCDQDCTGYLLAPRPDDLWPGERREDYGYDCGGRLSN